MPDRSKPRAARRQEPRLYQLRNVIRFVDDLPPPIRGRVGEMPVRLHVWPPDVVPSHPDAFRPRDGCLAGFWVLVRFGDDGDHESSPPPANLSTAAARSS